MRYTVPLLLLVLTACTPALRAASLSSAIDCGGGLLALGRPDAADYVRAAGCWLDRFAGEGLETAPARSPAPSEELGRAVVEAARANEYARERPEDSAAQRDVIKTLLRCEELSK